MKIIAQNRKAFHDYDIQETFEAGIVLKGDEVKSLRAGQVSLIGAFGVITQGELFLINCNISPYAQAYEKREEYATRTRKLLVHRRELGRLIGDISCKGVTLVPLKIYFNEKQKVKVELAICKHKKAASRKQELRERDIKKQTEREIRGRY